jgi:predicted  nucleic acid-binding Zn-ribbon protein
LLKPDEKSQEQIAQLVDKIMELYQDFHNTSKNTDKWHSLKAEIEKVEQQIDNEIYKLYGLTYEEIKIIEARQ